MKASVLFVLFTFCPRLIFDINFENKNSNIVTYTSNIFRLVKETTILSAYNIKVFVMLPYIVLFALFITQIEEKAFIIA